MLKLALATLMMSLFTLAHANATPLPRILAKETPFPGSTLYVPNDGKTHPGVIYLHGSEGGSNAGYKRDALNLAHHGYVVLAFCWYNCNKSTLTGPMDMLTNVDLNKTEKAYQWLKQLKEVGHHKTAIFGVSRGAEQALILGWKLNQKPDAIAVHAPSDTIVQGFNWGWMDKRCWICQTFDLACFKGEDDSSKWDWEHIRWNAACGPETKESEVDKIMAWTWNGAPLNAGPAIEIENYKGPLFITHGTADQLWGVDRSERLKARLEKNGLKPEVHLFKGEGHGFAPKAEMERWRLLLEFFRRHL